ncbi:MAG: hypothetical protein Ct9H300mP4_07450 [Gammaproteobacteria bacterium]|nr:MAG: hypothetical protein Ct9H300mP4_07450 [Gammaproteobacteria bacterium]
MAVYMSLLEPGDTILGMSLAEGGHLTQGPPRVNFSGRLYNFFGYGLDNKTGMIDYQRLEALAKEQNPKNDFWGVFLHILALQIGINLDR